MTKSQSASQPISTRIIPGLSTTVRHDSSSTSSHSHQPGSSNESVTQRLQRLRLENRRHQANLLRSSNLTTTSTSNGSIIHSVPIRRGLAENILSGLIDFDALPHKKDTFCLLETLFFACVISF